MSIRITQTSKDVWEATAAHGDVATARVFIRPDDRCYIRLPQAAHWSWDALSRGIQSALGCDLYVKTDPEEPASIRRLALAGFTEYRSEQRWIIPIDPERLKAAPSSEAVELIRADRVDLDRLRVLDDAIRDDIPGTEGWRSNPAEFAESSVGDSDFDPQLYLVAVHRETGEYVGLVRVWLKPSGPRLGCLGVLPSFRRTRVTRDLMTSVAATLADRGYKELNTETGIDNKASFALAAHHGGKPVGLDVEMIRRIEP